jgi:D-alanine-D-alanine ligase
MLFLAQFAPTDGVLLNEPKNNEERFYCETYHSKIIEVLNGMNIDFYSTSDVNHIMTNHNDYDLVWSLYNRLYFRNSEIFVQSLCEFYGLKYIGAAPNIRALVEDKSMAKQLAEHKNINTLDWIVASKRYMPPKFPPFNGTYFVKPRFGSASIGIDESCICNSWDAAISKSNEYFNNNTEVIIEKFCDGYCYGVPVLNSKNGEIIVGKPHYVSTNKPGNLMTYQQKRRTEGGLSVEFSDDDRLNNTLEYLSKKYFIEMQPCDYARIDFMVDKENGIPYFLEVNALMNLGINSGFVKSMMPSHFNSYEDIIRYIVNLGISKVDVD